MVKLNDQGKNSEPQQMNRWQKFKLGVKRIGRKIGGFFHTVATKAPEYYRRARKIAGDVSQAVQTGSDTIRKAGEIVGGDVGRKMQQASSKIDQYHQQAKDKINQGHGKAEGYYNKVKQLVQLGKGAAQNLRRG